MKRKPLFAIVGVLVLGAILWLALGTRGRTVITGIVATDDVIVSPEIQGRIVQLLVREGDSVRAGQVVARIKSDAWKADLAYSEQSELQANESMEQAQAELSYQKALTDSQIQQARANAEATRAQEAAAAADLEIAELNRSREETLHQSGTDSTQAYDVARTTHDGARARLASLHKQVAAADAAVKVALASAEEVSAHLASLKAAQHQWAALHAQTEKARVNLDTTEIRAPIDGIVDVRAARQGEVVGPGQAIVTLINPDDFWVRADVEEGAIDSIRLGDRLTVRLPSGAEREGTVFFRGLDADFATQRDVNRTKRDIKTFEVRLRCDNRDRALALGMTAYVLFARRR